VVGHEVKLQHVLDLVSNGPRPLTVRFRTEPTAEQPAALALALAPDAAAASTVSSLASETASAAQLVFDEQADVDALETLPSSLQGVPLNPLLGIVHNAWTTPGTYDRLAREQDDAVDHAHSRPRSQRGLGLHAQNSLSNAEESVQNRKSRGASSASAPAPTVAVPAVPAPTPAPAQAPVRVPAASAASAATAPAAAAGTSALQSATRAPAHEDEPRDPLTRP
jgi:hypothetical protein